MKLPFVSFRQDRSEDRRREPTLDLYRDPFDGSGPCSIVLSVPESLRQAVTEACPRCGAIGSGNGTGYCLLERLDLDIKGLDEEQATRTLRTRIGRLEPRLL